MARPFYTYMLRCSDGSYYVGHTDDLERRVAQHEMGVTGGYTATRKPIQLVWFEEFPTREGAKIVEVQVKKWSRRKKEALIAGKIDDLKDAARKNWAAYRLRRSAKSLSSLATALTEPTREVEVRESGHPE